VIKEEIMDINEFLKFMGNVKVHDLTQRLSIHTPPWPSYMPLGIQYFKRLAGAHMGQGANGQIITTSNHVGTHIDGEIHFHASGRTIGQVPIEEWIGSGVVVDISNDVDDYDLYSPEMLMKKAEIKKGDILIIDTGYHKYGWDQPDSDELRYFVKHPGPDPEFHKWALEMKFKWIGVDCGSADHPMNTIIRDWHPKPFKEAEKKLKEKYGKSWDEMFPLEEYYQVMHLNLFPKGLVHAENLGGDIKKVSNKRVWIGLFPLRGIELESSMCRIVALEPPE
jgi:kynurenine formamidase